MSYFLADFWQFWKLHGHSASNSQEGGEVRVTARRRQKARRTNGIFMGFKLIQCGKISVKSDFNQILRDVNGMFMDFHGMLMGC